MNKRQVFFETAMLCKCLVVRFLLPANVSVSVCPQGGEGEYLGRYPPGQVHPSSRQVPPWQVQPPGRYTPHQLQCMLGYGQQAGGTHPTGIHSCLLCDLLGFAKHFQDSPYIIWNCNKRKSDSTKVELNLPYFLYSRSFAERHLYYRYL